MCIQLKIIWLLQTKCELYSLFLLYAVSLSLNALKEREARILAETIDNDDNDYTRLEASKSIIEGDSVDLLPGSMLDTLFIWNDKIYRRMYTYKR